MFIRLKPPPSIADEAKSEVQKVLTRYQSAKAALSPRRKSRLEKKVRRWVEEWRENTAPERERLRERLEFMEGLEEATDFPFGSGQSSQLDVRYAITQERTMRANFIRSTFSDPQLIVAKVKPGVSRDQDVNKAESALNWILSEECNGIEVLKDTPTPIFRDGTALVYGDWIRRVESGVDQKVYQTPEEFQEDYPSAKDAGVSVEKYNELIEDLAKFGEELHVEYEMDFVSENGIKFTLFPLAKFIRYPLWVKDIKDALLYGYHYRLDGGDFEALVKQEYFDKEESEESRKPEGQGISSEFRDWDAVQDRVEGLGTEDNEESSYDLAKLVVRIDLDNDKVPEVYKIDWDLENNKCLRAERYGLWRNVPSVVPFRWLRRSGRMLGDAILGDNMDLYREINALHRHRSNVRRLTDSVSMIFPLSLKDHADLGAEYAEFKPGMTLWIPDQLMMESKIPRQLQLYNLSRSNDSMDEENLVVRYLDGVAGITQGQSGRETPSDPSAPASKTAMLLQRADMRGEDMVIEWSRSVAPFADLLRALVKANSGGKVPFRTKNKGEFEDSDLEIGTLTLPQLTFALKPTKLDMHPELEMNRIAALAAAAMKMGVVQINPGILVNFWNDFVVASRIENPERYMAEVSEQGISMGGRDMPMGQFEQIMRTAMMGQQGGMNGNANGGGEAINPGLARGPAAGQRTAKAA